MMKVVLIDDEPLHLVGMRSIIPWEAHGFTVVGEARTGKEGVEVIERERPDIVVVDILMPLMNGLEMIEALRSHGRSARFIVLSCMNDIEYYRRAIQLGVSEYLQKDLITPELLLEAVNRVAEEVRRERVLEGDKDASVVVNEDLVRTEFMNLVLSGVIQNGSTVAERLRGCGIEVEQGVRVASLGIRTQGEKAEELLAYSTIGICSQIWGKGACFFRVHSGQIAAILQDGSEVPIERMFSRMRMTAEQCLDCVLTMGVSEVIRDPLGIPAAYRLAVAAEEAGYFSGAGRLYMPSSVRRYDEAAYQAIKRRITHCIDETPPGKLAELIMASGTDRAHAVHVMTAYLYRCSASYRDFDVQPWIEALERADSLAEAADCVDRMVAAMSSAGGMVGAIRDYVQRSIRDRVSLEAVAEQVHMSASYVSRLFKRETGENLSDYIRREKIEEAKRCLRTHAVGDVAAMLGYSSTGHFISIFREQTGMTPLKYKKGIEGK